MWDLFWSSVSIVVGSSILNDGIKYTLSVGLHWRLADEKGD